MPPGGPAGPMVAITVELAPIEERLHPARGSEVLELLGPPWSVLHAACGRDVGDRIQAPGAHPLVGVRAAPAEVRDAGEQLEPLGDISLIDAHETQRPH